MERREGQAGRCVVREAEQRSCFEILAVGKGHVVDETQFGIAGSLSVEDLRESSPGRAIVCSIGLVDERLELRK